MGYVYKTTNILNNKIYIGQKKGEFNPNYFGSGLHVIRAINKYGKDKFKLEVIVYAEDKQKLDELEKQYIAEYREKFGRNNLYNIADGGEGGGFIGKHHPAAWCKQHSKRMSGENNPMKKLENSNKISIALAGKAKSSEHIKNLSVSNVGVIDSKETRMK